MTGLIPLGPEKPSHPILFPSSFVPKNRFPAVKAFRASIVHQDPLWLVIVENWVTYRFLSMP